jgi:Cu/Ag efflux protein CusF
MKNAWRFGLSSLAGLILVGGALALPATHTQSQEPSQATAQTQSVSGKIASVDKNSFTLTVGSAMEQSSQTPSTGAARTMSFSIDKNTTVEGTLKVGSNADVTYRSDNGANVAISVHVTP